MIRHVVALNAGSSTIKFALFELDGETPRSLASGLADSAGSARQLTARTPGGGIIHQESWTADGSGPFHTDALRRVLAWWRIAFPSANVVAAGHRVMHGGMNFSRPLIVTEAVLAELHRLIPLSPLHQPHNIAGIEAARLAWPHVLQVACFDTAFHRNHGLLDDLYALPRHFYDEGVRRYGFHGLSYEYITGRLHELAPLYAQGRVVIAHLGNGASMCAVRDGLSVASTMGLTALDGLPMGTRCGQLDPGVMLYLLQQRGMTPADISDLLYNQSGLLGLSGLSNDIRVLEASGKREAAEAIAYFVGHVRRELGGLAAVLNGLDAVVFCGGIGEHAWRVRESILDGMEWIGIELDRPANQISAQVISTGRSRVRVFVIPTNEEVLIAQHTVAILDHAIAA